MKIPNIVELLLAGEKHISQSWFIMSTGPMPLRVELFTGVEMEIMGQKDVFRVLASIHDMRMGTAQLTPALDGTELKLDTERGHYLTRIGRGRAEFRLPIADLDKREVVLVRSGMQLRTEMVESAITYAGAMPTAVNVG